MNVALIGAVRDSTAAAYSYQDVEAAQQSSLLQPQQSRWSGCKFRPRAMLGYVVSVMVTAIVFVIVLAAKGKL
jgi:type II secretory pathway component PulM